MKESNCTQPSFSIDLRVYYEDTDSGGVVYYANYLKFFERCRTEWVRSLGCSQSALAETHDLVFVVRRASADYYKPARLDDVLRVDLQIIELGRSRIRLAQRVVRVDGVNSELPSGGESVLVGGDVEIVCVRASTFKPVAIPAFFHATFQETV
jgi:acyl-CoA thioester hydrolase